MNSTASSDPIPQATSRPRWHRIYYLLAAFDVLTVSLGLLLTHRIMDIYDKSVEVNVVWVGLVQECSQLRRRAGAVNAPGNNVFEALADLRKSQEQKQAAITTAQESMKVDRAKFDKQVEALRAGLQRHASHLKHYLDESTRVMGDMTAAAQHIFMLLNTNGTVEAGKYMAVMDRHYDEVNAFLAELHEKMAEIQTENLYHQLGLAKALRLYELAIAGGILLMVGAATWYGHQLAAQAAQAAQGRTDLIARLRDATSHLDRRVRERTTELEQANVALRASEGRYRTLAKQVLTAQEDERRRIARDLHDEIGQSLTSLLIGLRTAEEAPSFTAARERLGELRRITGGTLDEVRRLARGLRPSVLDDLGLCPALERYADDYAQAHAIQVAVHVADLAERLPEEVETALYRIVQEALTNVVRHAQARTVHISAERSPAAVAVLVADDGRGFDCATILRKQAADRHLGLSGMRERAGLLNGTVIVESRPGAGTTVRVTIPLAEVRHGEDSCAHRG